MAETASESQAVVNFIARWELSETAILQMG